MRLNSIARNMTLTGVATGALLVLGGCLVGSRKSVSNEGNQVTSATLNQIESGKTRRDWVVAAMGEPTSKAALDDGGEIWKYTHTRKEMSSGFVLFIFAGSTVESKTGATYVEFDNAGTVRKSWQATE